MQVFKDNSPRGSSVLVACERSQVVTSAFLAAGFDAWSCDILPCYGDYPDRHILGDAIEALYSRPWSLVIAHPPCTYLTLSSACRIPSISANPARFNSLLAARRFFYEFVQYGVCGGRLCIENPRPLALASLPRNTQVVSPHEYGDPYTKRTYLWLYHLPPLFPTDIIIGCPSWVGSTSSQTKRSQFFPGLASAMVEQWGCLL